MVAERFHDVRTVRVGHLHQVVLGLGLDEDVLPGERLDHPGREVKDELFAFLASRRCSYEGTGPEKGLVAITIPKESDSASVLEYLSELESTGRAEWESANF